MGRNRTNSSRWVLGTLILTFLLLGCAGHRAEQPAVQPAPEDTVVVHPVQEPYPEPTIIFEEEDIPIEPAPEEEPVTQAPSFEFGFRV